MQFKGQTVEGVEFPELGGSAPAGDYDTAPDPSFIEQPINDIGVYKGRLFFLADENIILSRTREFFQFFPETVTTVLDTDPIDVVASNNRVSILQYAVPYQDELILFSDQYQFRFNAAETVLTPATAQITILTSYEIDQTSGHSRLLAESCSYSPAISGASSVSSASRCWHSADG